MRQEIHKILTKCMQAYMLNKTPSLLVGVCVMNGKSYTAGQEWYEGCELFCVCQDGTGNYTCSPR